MIRRVPKLAVSILIALAVCILAQLGSQMMIFDRWEKQGQDLIYRSCYKEVHPEEVVIIAIDQNSLDFFQRNFQILWPWPRDVYGLITDFLTQCGAKVIAYDVIFSSPDIDRLNVNAQYADAQFSEAMQRSGKVVLATQMEDATHITDESIVKKFNMSLKYSGPREFIREYPNLTAPIRQFQETMTLPGAVNFFTDDDGVCRRIPVLFQYDKRIIPYMALSAVAVFSNDSIFGYDPKAEEIILNDYAIPINKDGTVELFWYGPGGPGNTFHYVSFAQLLNSFMQIQQGEEPEIPVDTFKDKAVFIGATAAGLLDLKTTPFSPVEPYPGVEIYATLFSNIIHGEFATHFNKIVWFMFALFILTFLCNFWQKQKIWASMILSLIVVSVPIVVSILLYQRKLCFFPIVQSETAIILSVISVLVINYLTEGREKAMVKKVFNRYLHPAVVENLTKNSGKIEMGGKEIEGTVLFTDLQGFTGTSEMFTPHEIVEFLNEYFGQVENIIFRNNGMLDKYTGDGIMAIFGAPIENSEHAILSCRAVLDFKNLSKMQFEKAGKPVQLITRVGVNSGNLIVGNIGSSNRMDYTAIGDTVNLSARLEGVNKIYGTQNMISETTYEMVKHRILCREIDYIRVKGRDAALKIYTVIADQETADNKILEFLSIHNNALKLYRQYMYKNAIDAFREVLEIEAADTVAPVFIDRCQKLLKNPDLIDEKGIFNITVK